MRAVLSWGTPPSTTDPDLVPHWGNRLDTHVQIAPGRPYDGTARFVIVGGVPAAEIDPATGLTLPVAHLAVNGTPLDARGCPFSGLITLHGPTDPALVGSTYRVLVTNLTAGGTPTPLMSGFKTVGGLGQTLPSPTTNWLPGADGWLPWRGWMENTTGVLGWFTPSGEDRWQIDLEVQGIGIVDTKFVQLDNTLNVSGTTDPVNAADLQLDVAGNCDVRPGVITGRFVARDRHFGSWGLSVQGGPSSGFPTPPPAVTTPLAAAAGDERDARSPGARSSTTSPRCRRAATRSRSPSATARSSTAPRPGRSSLRLARALHPQELSDAAAIARVRAIAAVQSPTGSSSRASASASCCSCPCAAARRRRSTG